MINIPNGINWFEIACYHKVYKFMPIVQSRLPFFVIMSDIKDVGLDSMLKRTGAKNLDELVKNTVSTVVDENEEDEVEYLQCGQEIKNLISDDEEETQLPASKPSCSSTKSCNKKLLRQNVSTFGKVSRSLKRQNLIPETATTIPMKKMRGANQKTLMDQPLVPAESPVAYIQSMRSLMMTQTLLNFLSMLKRGLNMEAIEAILPMMDDIHPTWQILSQETKILAQTFIRAAIEALCQNPGVQFLNDLKSIHSDPIWSTTRSGIVVMKSASDWLNNLMSEIGLPLLSQTTNSNSHSSALPITTPTAFNTSTFCTTVGGYRDGAPVAVCNMSTP